MRDHDQLYKPTDTSVADQPPTTLLNLLTQPATPWKLDDNPAAQAAIKWIGSQDSLRKLGPNVRSAYWLQDFNKSDWTDLATKVSLTKYPGDDASQCNKTGGFCEPDFNTAQAELVREMGWVGDVRSYMADLGAPFNSDVLSSWDKLTSAVTDPIKGALNPPKNRQAIATTTEIIEAIVGVASGVGEVPGEVLGEAFNFALNSITEAPDGSDIDEIQANADQLGSQIKARLQTTAANFRQMGDIIVSDYAKLMTVATNERCNPTDRSCPAEWQFTARDHTAATTAIWKATEASFTKGVMRLAFPPSVLGPRGSPTDPRNNPKSNYRCGRTGAAVLQDEPSDGLATLLGARPSGYDVYALANFDNVDPFHLNPNTPPAKITARMFGALGTSLDPNKGGVGVYAPDYFREASEGDFQHLRRNGPGGYPYKCVWNGF
jgi:hypothetical protein